MSKNPEITVLMPVYNGEKYLEDAIKSILTQSYANYEFLIINDGSTDASAEVIERFSDKRIRSIKNPENLGLIATLNIGLDLALGKYIARMDQDDISLPLRFEKQLAFLESHPSVGVCGSWFELLDSKELVVRPVSNDQIQLHLLYDCAMGHPTVMMRSRVLRENNIRYDPMYKNAEDYEIWTRLMRVTEMHNIPDALLRYRIHPSQICNVNTLKQSEVANSIRLAQLGYLGINPTEREKLVHLAAIIGSCSAMVGKKEVKAWVEKLLLANATKEIYSENAFRTYLAERSYKYIRASSWVIPRKVQFIIKSSVKGWLAWGK